MCFRSNPTSGSTCNLELLLSLSQILWPQVNENDRVRCETAICRHCEWYGYRSVSGWKWLSTTMVWISMAQQCFCLWKGTWWWKVKLGQCSPGFALDHMITLSWWAIKSSQKVRFSNQTGFMCHKESSALISAIDSLHYLAIWNFNFPLLPADGRKGDI